MAFKRTPLWSEAMVDNWLGVFVFFYWSSEHHSELSHPRKEGMHVNDVTNEGKS